MIESRDTPKGTAVAAPPGSTRIDNAKTPAFQLEGAIAHGGETGRLVGTLDWSKTPLGPMAAWPHSLRVATSICLLSRFPIVIFWGPELALIYNDAYGVVMGNKHPTAMGQPGSVVWGEIWQTIAPMLDGVMRGGPATWSDDLLLEVSRYGFREEAYFTFSYSPIPDDGGGVGGIFCAVTETTAKVLEQRRLRTLRDMGALPGHEHSADAICQQAAEALGRNPADLPFALIYLLDDEAQAPRLAARVSAYQGWPPPSDSWHLDDVIQSGQSSLLENLQELEGWREGMPLHAIALPVARPGQLRPAAVLVAGLSPKLRFGTEYGTFLELAAAKLASALADAAAYVQERRRADELAELDRAKTAFFSNVSHEFRTPLTLLLGPLEELLAEPDVHDGDRTRLEMAHRNALRLLKLVNSLLDFSRLETGRLRARYAATDLALLTAEVASSFRSVFEKARLSFEVACDPLPHPVWVDRSLWEQIVLNLLSNAFKFTFDGGVTISLRNEAEHAVLTVADTGVGIPADEVPHLFERFYRVPGSRSRTYEGAGIGLALVHELVRMHGGAISVDSTVDRGSTFSVTIPYGTAHVPEQAAADDQVPSGIASAAFVEESLRWLPDVDVAQQGTRAVSGAGEAAANTTRSDRRILVADDNADLRAYLKRLLGPWWQVDLAGDGEEALAKARLWPPDLIVADVMMPRLDGMGLLRALRSDERTALVPVILLSARAGRESTVEGLEARADDYLSKPFAASELIARVRSNLEMAAARRSMAEAEREVERLSALERVRSNIINLAAHELRGPLATMRGYASMLEDGTITPGGPAWDRAVAMLNLKARAMSQLIQQILEAAKLEDGKLRLDSQTFDLRPVVRRAAEEVTTQTSNPRRLTLHLPDEEVLVVADPVRVGMIVSNIVDNAFKYSPDGGSVACSVESVDGTVSVRVQDHGLGIAPESTDLLFTRFGRIVTEGNSDIPGVGLGLFLAREIARLQGGDVVLEQSSPGEGSRFVLRLPAARGGGRSRGTTLPRAGEGESWDRNP